MSGRSYPIPTPKRYTSPRNVYMSRQEQTLRFEEVTFMRVGHNELEILKLLVESDGRISFWEVKQKLSGAGILKWRRMGYDKYHKISVRHKALVRATKTLEEKGLIKRVGYDHLGYLTRVKWLELTEKGRMAYLMRVKGSSPTTPTEEKP